MKPVVVIGSSNTDMVIRTKKAPVGGETVLGGGFIMVPGGKGANQAVAVNEQGTGLGLAIAMEIAMIHGTKIEVESAPGKGSTFSVFLPINKVKNE